MWSVPPAEPPEKATAPGFAFIAATRSFIVLCGEFAGTMIASDSAVRRAIGVTFASVTGDLFIAVAPTVTKPDTNSALGSPLLVLTNCARPMAPPAPPLLSNWALFTLPAACIAIVRLRPVWSKPPPGPAGIITFSWSMANAVPATANATAHDAPIKKRLRFIEPPSSDPKPGFVIRYISGRHRWRAAHPGARGRSRARRGSHRDAGKARVARCGPPVVRARCEIRTWRP